MVRKPDALNHELELRQAEERLKRENALRALRRLREIGRNLPPVDAAAVIRESRDLATQGSR